MVGAAGVALDKEGEGIPEQVLVVVVLAPRQQWQRGERVVDEEHAAMVAPAVVPLPHSKEQSVPYLAAHQATILRSITVLLSVVQATHHSKSDPLRSPPCP